jgi:hypothetical protein
MDVSKLAKLDVVWTLWNMLPFVNNPLLMVDSIWTITSLLARFGRGFS